MDCSNFVGNVYSDYLKSSFAAGQADEIKNKCVALDDIKPGDVFFTSCYDTKGKCNHCGELYHTKNRQGTITFSSF